MTNILIAFGTSEGHTASIAEFMADVIRENGFDVDTVDLSARSPKLEGYDAVIIGASVHVGKHASSVRRFVKRHREALERLPSAFFSVSLAAQDDTLTGRREVQRYTREFVEQTGWQPGRVSVFAGALLYTHYGFLKRWMMRKIASDRGSPDLDTSRDYVYTDWRSVRRFAESFLMTLAIQGAANKSMVGR
jgi:menaquinone-dependent protoporphyrinogen oxidase